MDNPLAEVPGISFKPNLFDHGNFRVEMVKIAFRANKSAIRVFQNDEQGLSASNGLRTAIIVPFNSLEHFWHLLPPFLFDIADQFHISDPFRLAQTTLILTKFRDSAMFTFLDTHGYGIFIDNQPRFFYKWDMIALPKFELPVPSQERVF